MRMRILMAIAVMLPHLDVAAQSPARVDLGAAENFAVLAGPSISITSGGTINGDVGVSPGSTFTQGGATINGTIHLADAVSLQGQNDLTTAYNDAAGRNNPTLVAGGALGGLTLSPGLYKDDGAPASLGLTGTLTLDALGDPSAVWIFQSASTLITEVDSRVVLTNGAQACNVFWQVGSAATLKSRTDFKGTIMAMSAITLQAEATLEGRALARTAAPVTLDNNTIGIPPCGPSTMGDFVWDDLNADGVQDVGEPGFSNVTVRLYDAGTNQMATTSSEANGAFAFTNLVSGLYFLGFVAPPGYALSPQGQGADPALDSDPDPLTARTALIALLYGQTITGLDAGLYHLQTDLAIFKTVSDETPDPGQLVWYTIIVTNNGPAKATSVIINELWPSAYVTLSNASPSQGTYDSTTHVWTVGSLEVDASATLALTGRVSAAAPPFTSITNTAELAAVDQLDSASSNNVSKAAMVTAVMLTRIEGMRYDDGTPGVEWETAAEWGTLGFRLWRWQDESWMTVGDFIPAVPGALQGAVYRVRDAGAGEKSVYRLEEIEYNGRREYGPFEVSLLPRAGVKRSAMSASADEPYTVQVRQQAASPDAVVRLLAKAAAPASGDGTWRPVMIAVREAGLYAVTADALAAVLGVDTEEVRDHIAAGELSLLHRGAPVAIEAAPDGAQILFFGQAPQGIESKDNVYRLNPQPGATMTCIEAPPQGQGAVDATFEATVAAEQDLFSISGLINDPSQDYWIWQWLSAGDKTAGARTFNLDAPGASASAATLTLTLFGATKTGVANEHHVQVRVNGMLCGEAHWTGLGVTEVEAQLPADLLKAGTNTLELKAIRDTGIPYSVWYLNRWTLRYTRHYTADQQALRFPGSGGTVTVRGFAGGEVRVFDITEPAAPLAVTGAVIEQADGGWQVSLATRADGVYLATGAPLSPASLRPAQLMDLANPSQRGRYVILAAPELLAGAERLAAYRESRGWRAQVVPLTAVYDEFGDGMTSLNAIRTFVKTAVTKWAMPPQAILLAGAGTYDYRQVRGYPGNLLPTPVTGTANGLTVWDGWYTDLDEDGLSDVAIGRLPARNDAELQAMVDKIEAYEAAAAASWQRHVILLADNTDQGGDFAQSSEKLKARLPSEYDTASVYLETGQTAVARTSLRTALTDGALFLNYFGHGALDRLAGEGLLTAADIATLGNKDRLPVMIMPTCAVGYHGLPGFDCLAETLVLQPDGGAVAVWAPAGVSLNDPAGELTTAIYDAVFQSQEATLGQAILRGQHDYQAKNISRSMLRIYSLMGDPALRLAGRAAVRWDDWKRENFTADEQDDPAVGGDEGDADGDGANNLVEYMFGENPREAHDNAGHLLLTENAGLDDVVLQIRQRKPSAGIQYSILWASDMRGPWRDATAWVSEIKRETADEQTDHVSYRFLFPDTDAIHLYLRIAAKPAP